MESYYKTTEEKAWTEREVSSFKLASNLVESMLRHNSEYPHSDNDFEIENINNFWIDTCEDCGSTNTKNHECLDCGSDEIGQPGIDILEWYIVDNFIAKKLEGLGEAVLYANGLNFWGRTCSGQAIVLDGTIQKIYRELNNEK